MQAKGGRLRRKEWERNPTPTTGRIHFKNTKARFLCKDHQTMQRATEVLDGVITLECGCKREQAA